MALIAGIVPLWRVGVLRVSGIDRARTVTLLRIRGPRVGIIARIAGSVPLSRIRVLRIGGIS